MPTVRIPRPLERRGFPWTAPTPPDGIEPPARRARTGVDVETAWARRWPARLARLAVTEGALRAGVRVLADPRRRGLDRLDGLEGPVIFAANHHSHLDTPLLVTSVPEPWRHRLVVAAAADYFFTSPARGAFFALVLGAIPIERTRVSRRSADEAAALIDEGWSLVIFPEGGRSPDGWGQEFRGGAAYLSVRCGVPVVPVHLAGTGTILRRGRMLPRPGTTTVTFGTPLTAHEGEDARRFGPRIEAAVAALADEAFTDWWSARRRAAAGATPPLTGPAAPTWRRAWALPDTHRSARRRPRWPAL